MAQELAHLDHNTEDQIERYRFTRLDALAEQIRADLQAVEAGLRTTVERAIQLGAKLLAVKSKVGHGQWEGWLRENFPAHPNTARNYMRLAENSAIVVASDYDSISEALAALPSRRKALPSSSSPAAAEAQEPGSELLVEATRMRVADSSGADTHPVEAAPEAPESDVPAAVEVVVEGELVSPSGPEEAPGDPPRSEEPPRPVVAPEDWSEEERDLLAQQRAGRTVVIHLDRHARLRDYAQGANLLTVVDDRSDWRNVFQAPGDGTPEQVVSKFSSWYLPYKDSLARRLPELAGRFLGCRCDGPCHAQALADYAEDAAKDLAATAA